MPIRAIRGATQVDADEKEHVLEVTRAMITELLEEIRQETAPSVRFDMRGTELPKTGDPNRPRRAS